MYTCSTCHESHKSLVAMIQISFCLNISLIILNRQNHFILCLLVSQTLVYYSFLFMKFKWLVRNICYDSTIIDLSRLPRLMVKSCSSYFNRIDHFFINYIMPIFLLLMYVHYLFFLNIIYLFLFFSCFKFLRYFLVVYVEYIQ
jgi:hypothetical protein